MVISKVSVSLLALSCGAIFAVIGLELLMQFLPVKRDRQFADNNINEPIIRGKASSIVEPIDWKFSHAQQRQVNNYGFVDNQNYLPNSRPVAVIGDSYIQAAMLPYLDTLQAKLSRKITNKFPVYSFGTPMYPLSGYLGTAKYVDREFQPRAYIFLLAKGDLTESIKSQYGTYFLDRPDGELQFKDAKINHISRTANQSSLYRYLYQQIYFKPQRIVPSWLNADPPTKSDFTADTYAKISNRLLDLFADLTNVTPQNTIFIIDSDRNSIYDKNYKADRDELSTFKQISVERGYHVVDTEELFTNYYQRTNKKLDFSPTDFHWNATANQLVADRVYPILANILAKEDAWKSIR